MTVNTNTIPIPTKPWTSLGRKIESKIRKALFDFQLIEGKNKIGVALSGGKDSITLLIMLHALSGHGFPDFEIHAFHITGEFSCGAGVDTDDLKQLCHALGATYHEEESHQTLETLSCYRCSRDRRSRIFAMAQKMSIDTVAFGHHRDDHVETGLMNLLHKGEFAGNLPKITMHDYGMTIIRPLIYVEESEIRRFAIQSGFLRMVCACPIGQNSMRKKVKDLLSEIEELYPNASSNIASAIHKYGTDKALKK